jgi:hypothetical protein
VSGQAKRWVLGVHDHIELTDNPVSKELFHSSKTHGPKSCIIPNCPRNPRLDECLGLKPTFWN